MANQKISQLTAGAPAQATDVLPIDRAGANFSLQVSDLSAAAVAAITSTPAVVYNNTTTGIIATTGAGVQTEFTPTQTGRYRINVIGWTAATDASGATCVLRSFNTTSNGAQGPTANAIPLLHVGTSQSVVQDCFVPDNGFTNYKMGFSLTVTGTPTTGTWSVNVTIEFLGN
jgi:hypothetical protein